MNPILSVLFLFAAAPQGAPVPVPNAEHQATEPREPLGRHLRQVEDIPEASGLLLDDGGGLWVLEGNRGRLLRIEADGGREVFATGLGKPRDVERSPDGGFLVTDAGSARVLRLDGAGKQILSIGEGALRAPHGLACAGERIFVTDTLSHQVQVFDLEGKALFAFGGHGLAEGQMIHPSDVAVDEAGLIYVADGDNSRVQVFDGEGQFLRSFGTWGPFPGLFFQPGGIEVRGDEIYVSDFGNHRVQVFNSVGEPIERFGLHAIRPREGKGFIHYPTALALSPNGEFAALAEPWVDRVQVFCRSGGTEEDAVRRQAMQLSKPSSHYGMHISCSGPYLAISEPESHSVVLFENTGDLPRRITRIGGLGSKTGLLSGVAGLHLDAASRELWVSDPVLRRISMFRLRGSEQDEVGYDALMGHFVKSVDFEALFELELKGRLEYIPEVIDIERDEQGRLYLLDRQNQGVIVLAKDLTVHALIGMGTFTEPAELVVDARGETLFVTDGEGVLWRFGGKDWEATAIARGLHPYGLCLDEKRGTLFVTDPVTHQLLRYGLDGEQQRAWGKQGLARGDFYKPRGVAMDHRGQVMVMDHGNHRLFRLSVDGEYQSVAGPRLYTRLVRYPHLIEERKQAEEDGE